MIVFTTIVSICSGLSVIIGLITLLVKPIREKVTRIKERDEELQRQFSDTNAKIDALSDSIRTVSERQDIDNAKENRSQILRFADEIYYGQLHSEEHFDDILDSITEYNNYCAEHPEFKNKRTEHAQRIIEQTYDECKEKHTFLV